MSIKQELPERRAREIINIAESIVDTSCPSGQVDLDAIIPPEVDLVYDSYGEEFDGKLEYESGRFSIHCNLDSGNAPGSPRGRYTISHELGHYFIASHRSALINGVVSSHPSFADKKLGNSLMEREANLFASHLLMPTARFTAALLRTRKGLGGIIDLSTKFKVSLTCAAIRYVIDEVEPSAAIKWNFSGTEWKLVSRGLRIRNFRLAATNIHALPKDSPTRMCISVGQTRSGVIDSKISATRWFQNVLHPHDLVLLEEAMTLGRFGGLTLLTLPNGLFPP